MRSGVIRTSVSSRLPCRTTSWPAANGMRWVNPSIATVSPSRTSEATASRRDVISAIGPSARVVGRDLRVDVHPHRLRLGVFVHRLEPHLAAVAGLPDAAEG